MNDIAAELSNSRIISAYRERTPGSADLAKEAGELVAEGGFKALKLRLGRERLADDLTAIREVRKAAGDDVKLMVDFNQGLTLGDALARCHALDDEGLYWFEEPIVYDNLAGYAQLARELKTPVQLGENFYGPRVLYEAIRAEAGDYVMPDLMRIGGVSGWLHAAAVAGAAGVQVSSHLYPEVSAHLLRVTETAHWWSGRIGSIRFCGSRTLSRTAALRFQTGPAPVSNGTRAR